MSKKKKDIEKEYGLPAGSLEVSASRDPVLDNRKKDRLKPVP